MMKNEQDEIKLLKEEELKEEKFWQGYNNKFKEQVKNENIFEEVFEFKTIKEKDKKNFFKKLFNILGF